MGSGVEVTVFVGVDEAATWIVGEIDVPTTVEHPARNKIPANKAPTNELLLNVFIDFHFTQPLEISFCRYAPYSNRKSPNHQSLITNP